MKKRKKIVKLTFLNLFFIIICFIGLIPIFYATSLSFSSGTDALSSKLSLLPRNFTWDNYKGILFDEPFLMWVKNSLILCVATMVIAMGFALFAAYAFSRHDFKGRKGILQLLLILNAFPQILSMFAIFRLFNEMGLLNTRIGLVIIYAGSMCIFSIWNMKGYFDTIPLEIEEAAKIDGASDSQLLLRIVLPLARPAIIVTSVMVLIFVWNEYIFATTFMLNSDSYTLAGGLYMLQTTDYSRNWPIFTAAAMLASIPILVVFFCIQKYMVSGLTAGGVKG